MFGVMLRFREGPLATHGVIVVDSSGPDNPSDQDPVFKLMRRSREKANVKEKKPVTRRNPAERQHYNEEYFDSFQSLEEAKRTVGKVVMFHRETGSVCGNFITNHRALKRAMTKEHMDEFIGTAETRWINEVDGHKGNLVAVYWDIKEDFLDHRIRIKRTFDCGEFPSRREVLELITRLDDPLGLMANTTMHIKVLLQELQKTNASWDGQVIDRSKLMWKMWLARVGVAGYATIPRSLTKGREFYRQLNVFVNGSDLAIAACIYLRSSSEGQRITVGLVAAATEVAPIQPIQSVPRLEFRAAELGAQLVNKVHEETRLQIDETILWTSSQTVHDWIHNPHRQYRSFVRKHIQSVLQLSRAEEWRFMPADQNPAFAATT